MEVIIDRLAWFKKSDFSEPAIQRIIQNDLTQALEDEYKGEETVELYEETEHFYGIPRQYACTKMLAGAKIIDNTQFPHSPDFPDFIGDYRQGQEKAVREILDGFTSPRGKYGGLLEAHCGSGKTVVGLKIASVLKTPVLVLVHKEDLRTQWVGKSRGPDGEMQGIKSFLPTCRIGLVQQNVHDFEGRHITLAMFQTVHSRMDELWAKGFFNKFGLVIVDECFVAGSLVDGRPIESLKKGDKVLSFNHTTGKIEKKKILRTHKNLPKSLLTINLQNSSQLICTSNHPIYVKGEGYILAGMVKEGDEVYVTDKENRDLQELREDSRMFWQETLQDQPRCSPSRGCALLREMRKGVQGQSGFGNHGKNKQKVCFGADVKKQSHEKQGFSGENEDNIKTDRPQTEEQGRERAGEDNTSENFMRDAERHSGTHRKNLQKTCRRLSSPLQNRHSPSSTKNSNRGRREESPSPEKKRRRQKERGITNFLRVEGVEIHEQTSDGRFGGMCKDGYVYNLEVEGNHNYFVENTLVHNCHHVPARTFEKVMCQFSGRYRLGLSATLRRRDGMECAFYWHIGSRLSKMVGEKVKGKYVQILWKPVIQEEMYQNRSGKVNLAKLITLLTEDANRNRYLLDQAERAVDAGRKILILSDRLEHIKRLEESFRKRRLKKGKLASVGRYVGNMSKKDLEHSAKQQLIIATYGMFCVPSTHLIKNPITGQEIMLKDLTRDFHKISYNVSTHRHYITEKGESFVEAGEKECLMISHTLGELKVSTDHRVLTDAGWKEAKNITEDDYLISPREIDLQEKDIPDLSKNDLYLLGAFLGDGCLVQKGFAEFTTGDAELLKHCNKILKTHRMKLKKIRKYHYRTKCFAGDKYWRKKLSWLQSVIRKYDLKKKCENKQVPVDFMFLPKEKIRYFLAGIFDTDGSITKKKGVIGLCGKNKFFMNQIVFLFNRVGFPTSKLTFSSAVWKFHIPKTYCRLFLKEIPSVLTRKKTLLKRKGDLFGATKLDIIPQKYVREMKEIMKREKISIQIAEEWLKEEGFAPTWLKQGTEGNFLAYKKLIEHYNMPMNIPTIRFIPIQKIKNTGKELVGDISVPPHKNYCLSDVVIHNSEGTDVPALDTLFLSTPRGDVEQMVGRIQRVFTGKKEPMVLDMVDDIGMCYALGRKRQTIFFGVGFTRQD